MATLQDVEKALEDLRSRLLGRPVLEISQAWHIPESWKTDSFPHSAQPGVYLFLDRSGLVQYIGKASFGLGKRVGSEYIGHSGTLKNAKVQGVATLFTIPLDKQLFFLAPTIEEFLIHQLNPPINRVGVRRDAP